MPQKNEGGLSGLRKLSLIYFIFAITLSMLGLAFKVGNEVPQFFWSAYLGGSLFCAIGAVALYLMAVHEECRTTQKGG